MPVTSDTDFRIVSTVSPITSIVENIGGSKVTLHGLIPEGTNSHTYEPSPSTVALLAEADLIIANGLFLEIPTLKLADANKKDDAIILRLGNEVITEEEWTWDESFPESGGHPNPHLWTDPTMGIRYAQVVAKQLSTLDPDNSHYYEKNLEAFSDRLTDLDARIKVAVNTILPEERKLLTYHDSFPTFAPRYGFETLGAIQPSDFTEPSAREVASLIDQIKEHNVPAIFGSEVFPSPILSQIAKESGATFVDKLRDDDLPGDQGDDVHTYHGLLHYDVMIIVPALGGDASSLQDFDTRPTFSQASQAVYPK
ncbi:MAG: metal ABC transporter substrate-binding protein [Chloroflexota bacterium]|nr:metal ABC transporter substrate-binding protein [Chloroflexota bacterium]